VSVALPPGEIVVFGDVMTAEGDATTLNVALPDTVPEDPQRVLEFDDLEKRQLEAERNQMRKRAAEIPGELVREPEGIRANYTVKAQRLEPVGVVYLWPVSG
jgi:hypothetical protein